LTAEVADPDVLAAAAAVTRVVAAGPGWDPRSLPAEVLHADGLAATADAVTTAVG
jgi:hypothetical protein